MAKTPETPAGNGSETNGSGAAASEKGAPSLNVLAQYIKDLSFENPHAPQSLRPREKAPEINISMNVNPSRLSDTDYEVELKMEAKAGEGADAMFAAELVYAGVFRLTNIPEEAVGPTLMIECPRLLFPFARQIIADSTRQGGFPPLMIDPVDFAALFQQSMAEQNVRSQMESSN